MSVDLRASVDVVEKVRRALGRRGPLAAAPVPPEIPEPVVRLVHSDIGLPALFAGRAVENQMEVVRCRPEDVGRRAAECLAASGSRRIALAESRLLEDLGVAGALAAAGLEVRPARAVSRDELYGFDAAVTDVWAAVAETGSLVVRSSPRRGPALSLVPPVHVAVVEPRNCVPDLVDLMEKIEREGAGPAYTLITGPSKTADIEMSLVVGVHGPAAVHILLIN